MKRAVLVGAVGSTRVLLDCLLESPDWEVDLVLTLPPEDAARHSDFEDLASPARAAGVDVEFCKETASPEAAALLGGRSFDRVFVVGWSRLCSREFLEACGTEVVGYHPAPLPLLRGRAVLPWTILLEMPITASSLFYLAPDVDAGPLLDQEFFLVPQDWYVGALYEAHLGALRRMLQRLLPSLARDSVAPTPQDHALATWATRRNRSDGLVDWRSDAMAVQRLIRAVSEPYPGAFTFDSKGNEILLWRSHQWESSARYHGRPGQVLFRNEQGFAVACGDGEALWVSAWSYDKGMPGLHSILGGK